eukprot:TRINITY_DN1685_c0_g1_i1.p1 TRINITY_DN1685_c0_g1~~TRINITY_DN1685_c0_g1_i1.p1  ORF type:complete len:185 (+),score=38.24 TRINITY_DN1685_c0_g1_i1:99-653(+)
MGLWKIIQKIKQNEREMRILLLGLDNAGKTTFVKYINGQDVHHVSPTLGFQISSFLYQEKKLNIWDIGGQRSIRAYWKNYFEETDGIIWVVDSADPVRLEDCRIELSKVLGEEKLAGASLLILANKQDIPGALSVGEIYEALDLGSITTRNTHVIASSAITGEGLESGINWIVEEISLRIFTFT